jgi:hypothetical protein
MSGDLTDLPEAKEESTMLHEFLTENRQELITRCREKVALRDAPASHGAELDHGIGYFLDQLIKTLALEQSADPQSSRRVSGAAGGKRHRTSEIAEAASKHGRELLRHGFTLIRWCTIMAISASPSPILPSSAMSL